MMKRIILAALLLILVDRCCLAQVSPAAIVLADSAKLLGEGSISTGDFSFNATFTPDGDTVFFSRATTNFGYIAIFYSVKKGSGWSEAEPVSFTGIYRDTDPVIAADGRRLYFSSDRPIVGQGFKDYDYHLFYVELNGNKILSQPQLLPLPAGVSASYPSFADNGNLYFFAIENGDTEIYKSAYKDGKYLPPVKLPFNSNKYFDLDPVVAGDESFIVFASTNRKGFGGSDLWVAFRQGDTWTEPVNMGSKVNSAGSDGAPGLSRDHKTLYFSSFREKMERPAYKGKITTKAIMEVFHSTKNGVRKIYHISIADLKNPQ